MWLTVVIIMVLFAGLIIYLGIIRESLWGIAPLCCMFLAIIPSVCTTNPPIINYPHEAIVAIEHDKTKIYFNDFVQNDNEIIIDSYCVNAGHWLDFKGYDVIEKPLKIVLINQREFEYVDRVTGESSLKIDDGVQVATQP